MDTEVNHQDCGRTGDILDHGASPTPSSGALPPLEKQRAFMMNDFRSHIQGVNPPPSAFDPGMTGSMHHGWNSNCDPASGHNYHQHYQHYPPYPPMHQTPNPYHFNPPPYCNYNTATAHAHSGWHGYGYGLPRPHYPSYANSYPNQYYPYHHHPANWGPPPFAGNPTWLEPGPGPGPLQSRPLLRAVRTLRPRSPQQSFTLPGVSPFLETPVQKDLNSSTSRALTLGAPDVLPAKPTPKRNLDSPIVEMSPPAVAVGSDVIQLQDEGNKAEDKLEAGSENEKESSSSYKKSSIIAITSKSKVEDSSEHDVKYSTDSEQELPSSAIKTPVATGEPKKENVQNETSVFGTKLIMGDPGHFHAVAYNVSHSSLEGTIFPESPVQLVGRTPPETLWDYIDKRKKTNNKEIIVFRLAPASEADCPSYKNFFSYFSSRGRFGVLGGISPPLKGVYLIPLNQDSPINRALLPFGGPGLPQERNNCLLAVVIRHIIDLPPTMQPKRKTSLQCQSAEASSPTTKKKRTKDAADAAGLVELPSSSTSDVPARGQLGKLNRIAGMVSKI